MTEAGAASGTHDPLIEHAERVRDYLITSGSGAAAPLISALAPFEAETAVPADRAALQQAANEAFAQIDEATLEAIISGRFTSGTRQRTPGTTGFFRVSNVAAAIGLVLMVISLHFTHWSVRADAVLVSFSNVTTLQDTIDLEDMANMIDLCEVQGQTIDDGDVSRYISSFRVIEHYDIISQKAQQDLSALLLSFNISRVVQDWFVRQYLKVFPPADSQTRASGQLLGPAPDRGGNLESICESLRAGSRDVNDEFEAYRANLEQIGNRVPVRNHDFLFSGRGTAWIQIYKEQLLERKSLINRWFLPVLHGALGGVIFCLVRSLRRFSVPVTYKELFLRLFFGAFIGFAVSALLIPSGILSVQLASPTPFASLMAFAFGYSIDSFLAIMNRINDYFAGLSVKAGAPRDPKP